MNLLSIEYHQLFEQIKAKRLKYAQQILKNKTLTHKNKTMKFQYFIHGQKPSHGYRLIFGLHGGGGCPSQVNQQQYNNHKHLYDGLLPSGSIWFVFRSAEQASDMWWKQYVPQFIILIIQCFTIKDMINQNKVFITGYSAGGDGIYHLASMLADYLAGAAMMAGHPNHVDIQNLRNVVFSIQLGEDDHAYDRSHLGKAYIQKLNSYRQQYGGFRHYSKIHPHTPHWMNKQQAYMFPYFFNQTRQPYPDYLLFKQHPRTFKRIFYYIKVQEHHPGIIFILRTGNKFQIQSQIFPVTLMLNRYFVDENKDIQVYHNGELIVKRRIQINKEIVNNSIEEYMDPWYVFEDQIISIPNRKPKKNFHIRPFDEDKRKCQKLDQSHNVNNEQQINVKSQNKKHSISNGLHKTKEELQKCTIY